jgi:hypothetical protein
MSVRETNAELHVHSVDGHVSRFNVEGAAAVQELLERVQPGRVFSLPHLVVGGAHSLSIFPSASVVRVDLVMHQFPEWAFPYGASDILELSAEEFEERYEPAMDAALKATADGLPIVIYAEFELASGQRVFMEVHTRAETRLPVELGMFFQQILTAPSLFGRRRGGGAVMLNPANIVRLTFHPGPRNAPPNMIAAEPVTESAGSEFVLVLNE